MLFTFRKIRQVTDLLAVITKCCWSREIRRQVAVVQTTAQRVGDMSAGHMVRHAPRRHARRHHIGRCQKSCSVSTHEAGSRRLWAINKPPCISVLMKKKT